MTHRRFKKLIALSLAASMGASYLTPAAAFATQSHVRLENHATQTTAELSRLKVGELDAPESGVALDSQATVSSAEGQSWDIPVLWLDSHMQLATMAQEGQSYLPALAFFLPSGYAAQSSDMAGGYAVELADDLVELFDGEELISVYEESSQVTYIIPASLQRYFGADALALGAVGLSQGLSTLIDSLKGRDGLGGGLASNLADPALSPADASVPEAFDPDGLYPGHSDSAETPVVHPARLADVYCSQLAHDVLGKDDLDFLVDLIVKELQPKAAQMLAEAHPGFDIAAAQAAIEGGVGLFIHYGSANLTDTEGAVALVADADRSAEDLSRYGYLIGVDTSSCVKLDNDGAGSLVREGEEFETLTGNIVEDLFEAYSLSYSRTNAISVSALSETLAAEEGWITIPALPTPGPVGPSAAAAENGSVYLDGYDSDAASSDAEAATEAYSFDSEASASAGEGSLASDEDSVAPGTTSGSGSLLNITVDFESDEEEDGKAITIEPLPATPQTSASSDNTASDAKKAAAE